MSQIHSLSEETKKRVQSWLDSPLDPLIKKEILTLLEKDPKQLEDAFFKDLSFGTGGMRGIMGLGTARINLYTIRMATQGLANCLRSLFQEDLSVFIGYDMRHHSREFAIEAAKVLAGNGITALVSKDVCPTPLTSFACRYFGCTAAIMITASHNPPEYNGYKVYGPGGGQIVPPLDQQIMDEVQSIDSPAKVLLKDQYQEVGEELDRAYLQELQVLQNLPEMREVDLKIVYTNLHGTGSRLMTKALGSWGFNNVSLVKKQLALDPLFTNAPSPNPEDPKALEMGTAQLISERGDLLLATDPDADRIGVAIPEYCFNGHEIACLCLEHICETLLEKQELPENGAVIKSIVTTDLFRNIAESYQIKCVDVLTGFKYIGKLIGVWEHASDGYQFLFGAEESYGYLISPFVRDKDAISTACLIAEMTAKWKKKGKTLLGALQELYQKYQIHRQLLKSLQFENSQEGMNQMALFMKNLRENPPQKIHEKRVSHFEDFSKGLLSLPPTDMVRLSLEDQTKLIIRPSGTEPKIKIYLEAVGLKEESPETIDLRLKALFESFQTDTGIHRI